MNERLEISEKSLVECENEEKDNESETLQRWNRIFHSI